jgi:hypothetical protein
MAEKETVPVCIREMTDAQVLEAQLVENLQRQDVHPLHEAQGFAALLRLEEPKYSIELIAAKCGKHPGYVASRLRLTELAPAAVEAFTKDEIGLGHALLLAKLKPEQQEEALTACWQESYTGGSKAKCILLPVRHLREWIEHNILLELATAPFSKKDATLVPEAGSCHDCSKRTGHNTLLFEGIAAQHDSCKLCGIWATASLSCRLLVAAPSARGACNPAICSSGSSNRRSIWLVILSSTLSVGIGAHWLRPILMLALGSLSSPIAAWLRTRSTLTRAPSNTI